VLTAGRKTAVVASPLVGVARARAASPSASALNMQKPARVTPSTRLNTPAGRCIAFELPTAAGFHVARATETIILKLMDAAGMPPLASRNWGAYVNVLKKSSVDAKITEHIDQVRELHRNPLIHPEESLDMSEALVLWTVCIGLIGAMYREMDRLTQQPPTGN